MSDARFQDGVESALRLAARDVDDLRVLSSLVQDAVLTAADMRYLPRERRFALLLNRVRWEDSALAASGERPVERVRAVLDFGDVRAVRQQGLGTRDANIVLSLLAIDFQPEEIAATDGGEAAATGLPAGPGSVTLLFSGDGAIALDVECLEVHLSDVTRPYAAPSGRLPAHRMND